MAGKASLIAAAPAMVARPPPTALIAGEVSEAIAPASKLPSRASGADNG